MGLFGRRDADDRDDRSRDDRIDDGDRTERAGTSPGLIRAFFTLASVVGAGLLIWIAQSISGPLAEASTSDYWWAVLFLAAAGLVLGLAQLFGGWTKWGWPTLSPTVFLFGFLPTLIVGGWILLAKQPQSGVEEGRFDGWSDDLGVAGFIDDLNVLLPAIPLIVGLILAFSFDTTGPRTRIVSRDIDRDRDRDRTVRDEDVQDYRPVGAGTTTTDTTSTSDTTVAEDLRRREPVSTGASDERVEVRDPNRRDTV